MDEAQVTRWLTDYVAAWKSYDPAAIAELFTEEAVYRYHPWDELDQVLRGSEAIVASWLEEPDAAVSWTAEYRPWIVEGDKAVAVGVSRYFADDGRTVEREYHNVFLLAFDGDGRCREFTELFMPRPT